MIYLFQLLTTPDPPSMDLSSQHTPENIIGIHDNIMLSVSGAPRTMRKISRMQHNLSRNVCNLNQLIGQQETDSSEVIMSDGQSIAMRGYKSGVGQSLLSEALFLSPLSPRYVVPCPILRVLQRIQAETHTNHYESFFQIYYLPIFFSNSMEDLNL